MLKSLKYVLHENITNIYRIYTISKYEIRADIKDSKLGIFWNFAAPLIQVLTYWFVFGIVLDRPSMQGVPYIYWMLAGMVVWFYISPSITNGTKAIHAKMNIISKMQFPVSILPATVVLKELFNHLCLLTIVIPLIIFGGFLPSIHWLGLLYYMFCGFIFSLAISMVLSVLNMLARDTRKLILASMRLLLYLTPILWSLQDLPKQLVGLMSLNPIHYVVQGYRDCFFFQEGILFYSNEMLIFWSITLILLTIGCYLMYKFKYKFIDLM